MEIRWRKVDTYRTERSRRYVFAAQVEYCPNLFSNAFDRKLHELRSAGCLFRLRTIRLWRNLEGERDSYYVFSPLNIRHGKILLETAVSSPECPCIQESLTAATLIGGTLKHTGAPIRAGLGNKGLIERRALKIAFAANALEPYWHRVEVAYQSWHPGSLVAVPALSESRFRTVHKHFDLDGLITLSSKYESQRTSRFETLEHVGHFGLPAETTFNLHAAR